MTMLTCLRLIAKDFQYPITITKVVSSFKFSSYGEEYILSEKYTFEYGAIHCVGLAWMQLNRP